jgi:hypothetical protein
MTVRRVLSLLCLALCATALVGCSGDTLALDPVAKAANRTAHAESSRFVFSASLTAANMGSFSFHGNGLYDGKNNSGWANMHFNLPPQVMAQFGSDPSMEMIFDGSDGLVMYMRSGLFKTLPAGTWVKMDVAKLAKKEGYDLDALMSANQADPSQALKMLMASSGARVTGFETVRGVQTTHYAFHIDFKRLLHDNKALRQLREAAGADSIPAEAWIDKQGRVRRLTVNMSIGAQYGTGMSMTITEDLYDFGVKAHVVAPPDSLVTDISKLTGSSS